MDGVELFISPIPFGYNGDKFYIIISWKPPSWAVPGVTNYLFYVIPEGGVSRSWQQTIDLHNALLTNPDAYHANPHVTKGTYIYALVPRGQSYHVEVSGTNDLDENGNIYYFTSSQNPLSAASVMSPILSKDFVAPEQ